MDSSSQSFEQRFKDKTVLECWVINPEAEHGFEVNLDITREIMTGVVNGLDYVEDGAYLPEKAEQEYEFLLYKVAVGRAYGF